MPELWQMMEPGVDPSVRTSALTLVAQRHDLTPEETDHVFNETLAALRDSDVSLKLYAIYMLAFLQDVRAVPRPANRNPGGEGRNCPASDGVDVEAPAGHTSRSEIANGKRVAECISK
jgi:hypothetical protein